MAPDIGLLVMSNITVNNIEGGPTMVKSIYQLDACIYLASQIAEDQRCRLQRLESAPIKVS